MKIWAIFVLGLLNASFAVAQELHCDPSEDIMPAPECPDHEDGRPTYFPYPYDCTKYFECSNKVARCFQCPPATRWDDIIETCNHESITPCNEFTTTPRPSPTTTTPTTTTPTTTTPTTTTPTTTTPTTTTPTTTTPTTTTPTTTTPTTTTSTTTEKPTTSDDPADWICPDDYLGPIGHPWTCRQFYICDPGHRPCLYDCPGDLYFDPIRLICDWQENVPSCQGGTPPPPTSRPLAASKTAERFNFVQRLSQKYQDDPCEATPTPKYPKHL